MSDPTCHTPHPCRPAARLLWLAAALLLWLSQTAGAASCTVGSSGVSYFGVELFATRDYGNGHFDYNVKALRCSGGRVISWMDNTIIDIDPVSATQQNRNPNLSRDFSNSCGTHITLIHNNFNGTIGGISLASTAYPLNASYPDIFGNDLVDNLPPLPCLCGTGQVRNAQGMCMAAAEGKQVGAPQTCQDKQSQPSTDHPIGIGNGYKFWQETLYSSGGLSYRLSYTSRKAADQYKPIHSHGANWLNEYEAKLVPEANGTAASGPSAVYPQRPNGRLLAFRLAGGVYTPDADVNDSLTRLINAGGGTTGWRLTDAATQTTETYDAVGKLQSITDLNGTTRALGYDGSGRLSSITDAFGRTLSLGYDGSGKVATLTHPDGGVIHFGYDTDRNLVTITWPDARVRQFHYENTALRNSLTGITDENGARHATFGFDADGLATSESLAEGADAVTLAFGTGTTTVTDALGSNRTYGFTPVLGVPRTTGTTQPAGSGCGAASSGVSYDANGNMSTRTDFNGNQTQYTYDLARNLETRRVEGLSGTGTATAATRTISTQWHPDWRLASRIAEPLRITTLVYNGQPDPTSGNAVLSCAPPTALVNGRPIAVLCRKIEQATADTDGSAGFAASPLPGAASTRVWNHTYNSHGQGLTVDGPRTDVADVTAYAWYADTDADPAKRGNLASVTGALGHVWNYTAYDANGRLLSVTDPNGTVTAYTYTPRGWLKTRTVAGDLTTFNYDFAGQLASITFPDNSSATYTYDAAHRLTGITDATGHHLHYTLDAAGNRTREEYLNADGSVAREMNRTFDALGRLQTEINGPVTQAGSTYGYFANGELKTSATPRNDTTTLEIDTLGRTTKRIDPINGTARPTLLGYDAQDGLVSYTAPNGAATSYTVDGLGNTQQEVSPESGSSNATFDAAGNLLTRQDARGVTVAYQYDALDRLIRIDTPAVGSLPAGSRVFIWDAAPGCTHGVGHLCQVTDEAGSTVYDYDAHGNRVSETRTEDGQSFITRQAWNAANRPTDIIPPSAETVAVTLDPAGQVQAISTTSPASVTTAIAQDIGYSATGKIYSQLLGLSLLNQTFDAAGRLNSGSGTDTSGVDSGDGSAPIPAWALMLLGAGLMGGMARRGRGQHPGMGTGAILLPFMVLAGSLGMAAPAHAADLGLTYDANGNVSSKSTPAGTTTYTWDALDRIDTESGPAGGRDHEFDANGNRTSDGAGTMSSFTASTDRLATVNGIAVTLDAVGNVTYDGTFRYVWDARNQLRELRSAGNALIASYFYDYRGLRTRKVTTASAPQGASTTFYHYDHQGRLVGESASSAMPLVTYVWNGDILTGVVVHQPVRSVYTVQVDHLGSPFQVRSLQGRVLWRWDSEAFGKSPPNEDVDGDAQKLTLNLRFPGQFFDQESGLHYNWHRYYSPMLARYLSQDPIGLEGGSNRFAYVNGNPMRWSDPMGLKGGCPTGMAPDGNRVCRLSPDEDPNAHVCVTAECAAGLPPAVSENRSQGKIEQSQCELVCGIAWPGPILPLSKVELLPWVGGQVSSYLGCKWLCKDPNRRRSYCQGR